jgi:hypothetical protein
MRHATFCVITALVGALPLCAEAAVRPPVTVILDFKQAEPNMVLTEMKRATEEILSGSGVRLNWRMRSDVGSEAFAELVLVTFHGTCAIDADTPRIAMAGPLASSQVVDDQVLPFADVYCDHVAAIARAAMTHTDRSNTHRDMGRALAKVLAHELMHMITKSSQHGAEGVAKPALSGRQLLDESTRMAPRDLDRIREVAFR